MNHELSNTINNSVHLTTATDSTSDQAVLQAYDDVFNSTIVGNNGATGPVEATVNMGPVQLPQRKGRIPQYSRHKLAELQEKYDEPEQWQVFHQLKDVVLSPEYLNPSFLIKKPLGGFRLVSTFTDISRYGKQQPSLILAVDSTLWTIAPWKYIIRTKYRTRIILTLVVC